MPNNMVSTPSGSNSFATPSNGDGPGNGAELGGTIKGFGSGKPDASTINAVGAKLGQSPQALGPTIRGFSGNGTLAGKI